MAEFEVNAVKLKGYAENIQDVSEKLNTYKIKISTVSRNLNGVIGSSYSIIAKTLTDASVALDKFRKTANTMQSVLKDVAKHYSATEEAIISKGTKVYIQAYSSGSTGNAEANTSAEKGKASAEGSVSAWQGKAGVNAVDGLAAIDGKLTVLGLSAKAKAELEPWKASGEASVSAAVLGGAVTQTSIWGLQEFKAKGQVLGGEAKVKGQATLTGISGKAEANAAVVKGSVENRIGLENYNVHGKAEGYVIGAAAGASGGIGVYDKDGKTQFGIHAKGEAEAYLTKGEVKGGFTLGGVKVDAKVGGGIGAGAKAKFEFSSKSITIGAGAAAILGIEGEVTVDWSNFKLW